MCRFVMLVNFGLIFGQFSICPIFLISTSGAFVHVEWKNKSQEDAYQFLKIHNLLLENLKQDSKWKTQYSDKKKGLYILQCSCGSDIKLKSSLTRKNRQMYTFIGCLAFAKIKKDKDNNYVALDSYLKHLDVCINSKPQQSPPLHINETVKIIAINMLKVQIHPATILEDNMKFIELNLGGNVLIDNERLMLVLATLEQKKLAWKYGHNGIIHFNRTFGFSNKKVLLFVLLVVNQNNKRIPIGYLLFSAASGVQRISSSYNHAILKELLKQYKDKISIENNHEFLPKVAITDTDHKERLALLEVWPHIHLLLCEFHIIQCWENKMKQVLEHFTTRDPGRNQNI
ncbi:hypothetical protein RhiirA4_514390 [Rhizophagus irregularis]|uniref:MULE transposase domain-containing protein n=1 Tax=Rhizophagus irregularis TaxID=588596 RepID=A0A2I1HJR7_9GLOM|nr:hypothetical protein RhiirA4_514390 [Rhizophagus irregularis]